jgi:hypothetical protein
MPGLFDSASTRGAKVALRATWESCGRGIDYGLATDLSSLPEKAARLSRLLIAGRQRFITMARPFCVTVPRQIHHRTL